MNTWIGNFLFWSQLTRCLGASLIFFSLSFATYSDHSLSIWYINVCIAVYNTLKDASVRIRIIWNRCVSNIKNIFEQYGIGTMKRATNKNRFNFSGKTRNFLIHEWQRTFHFLSEFHSMYSLDCTSERQYAWHILKKLGYFDIFRDIYNGNIWSVTMFSIVKLRILPFALKKISSVTDAT